MPGLRNYQREYAQHRLDAPARQAAIYQMLHTQLPQLEQALIGRDAILTYLHDLGLRRPNGDRLTWRILLRWRRDRNCPILRGNRNTKRGVSPLSTSHALTAWLLASFTADDDWRWVASARPVSTPGSFYTTQDAGEQPSQHNAAA